MARITVRLTPRGGHNAIDGWRDGVLQARVSAAPVDSKANDALVRLLARALGVPPSRIEIVAGGKSRLKQVEIDGLSEDDVHSALAHAGES